MIEIKHLTKSFGDKTVLHDINTTFETGKTNLIIGQSGSGKTVLMKNIIGLLTPTSGEVLFDGRDIVTMSKKAKVELRREMGMVFQGSALFDSLTVLENVRFPLDMFSSLNSASATRGRKNAWSVSTCSTRKTSIPLRYPAACKSAWR